MIGRTSVVLFVLVLAGVSRAKAENTELKDFDDAQFKENCTKILFNLVTPKGEITCEEMFIWSKCFVRVLGLHQKVPTEEDVKGFNDNLEQILKDITLKCSIDINDVITALRTNEPEYPTTASTTSEPVTVTTSTTTARTTLKPGKDCLQYSESACADRENGNYPACYPSCQKGIYITCSNFIAHTRPCANGWYQPKDMVPPEGRFEAPMVYNWFWDMCMPATPDCPRDSDSMVEG